MALINLQAESPAGGAETMFCPPAQNTPSVTSMVKEMARYGAGRADFVPQEIIGDATVQRKMDSRRMADGHRRGRITGICSLR